MRCRPSTRAAPVEYIGFCLRPGATGGEEQENLADAVDMFCESIGFSPAQCERVLQTARALGLPTKVHADQLSDLGGGALAARYGSLSADHSGVRVTAERRCNGRCRDGRRPAPGRVLFFA